MIKLLLNAYNEFPTPHQGGPNKVIFEIINNIDRSLFDPYYLSKHLFSFIEENQLLEKYVNNKLSLKKTVSVNLIKNSILFKKIVTVPFYLRYHFAKTNEFYKNLNINNYNYDVLHSHDVKSFALLHSKIKCKKILTIHSKGPIQDDLSDYFGNSKILSETFNTFDLMEDESISEAEIITFPSYAALELFKSKKNIDENKTKVIYNGIDKNLIQKINTTISFEKVFKIDTKPYIKIINIADHIEPKNIELIILVLNELINYMNVNILFINVGSGPLTNKYLLKAKELRIAENVRFIGKLKNDDVLTLLKDADYLISPAERVIFDYVILEALACGTTVIASDIGGNKEIITHNENGYLLKELHPKSISNQFNLFPKIDITRLQNSLERFSHLKMINEYQNLYL